MVSAEFLEMTTDVSVMSAIETAITGSYGDYVAGSLQIQDMAVHSETNQLCVVGYIYDATTEDGTVPVIVASDDATAAEAFENRNYVVHVASANTTPPGDSSEREASAYMGLAEIPSTSTDFSAYDFIVVGFSYDGNTTYWDSSDSTPNQPVHPLIAGVGADGITVIISSYVTGTVDPEAWQNTADASTPTFLPRYLLDVCYDAQNDSCVAVGGCQAARNTTTRGSYGMFVEIINPTSITAASTQTVIEGIHANGNDYPTIFRRCDIQTQNTAGATVSNRTIVLTVGQNWDNGAAPNATSIVMAYQPNFSNAWGSITPRGCALERGIDNAADLWKQLSLTADNSPKDLFVCKRVTADDEDLWHIAGISTDGPTLLVFKNFKTDSGSGDDNVINQYGTDTDISFDDYSDLSATIRTNWPSDMTQGRNTTITDVTAGSVRDVKLVAGGNHWRGPANMYNQSQSSGVFGDDATVLFGVTRGWLDFTDLNDYNPGPTNSLLLIHPTTTTTNDEFVFMTSGTLTAASNSVSASDANTVSYKTGVTGRRAYAYAEYLLYDGVDGLVARKLQDLGMRVTIPNVEWYKREILNAMADVSSDFFNEWASEMKRESDERQRELERIGRAPPRKRPVAEPIFDDYNDWVEDEEMARENVEMMDPEDPWSDEVGEDQRDRKVEKQAMDQQTIDELHGTDGDTRKLGNTNRKAKKNLEDTSE